MFMPFFTMKSRKLAFLGASATLALLSACSGFYYDKSAISDQADLNNPPRLYRATGNQNQLEWDRPDAFGRVPAHLQSRGNVVCSILGKTSLLLVITLMLWIKMVKPSQAVVISADAFKLLI